MGILRIQNKITDFLVILAGTFFILFFKKLDITIMFNKTLVVVLIYIAISSQCGWHTDR